jgi:hypothetical protein
MKRRLLQYLAAGPWLVGCGILGEAMDATQRRFKGIGLIMVVDAVPGAEMREVEFYDDKGQRVYASSLVARRNREVLSFGSVRAPLTIRAVWREGAGWDAVRKVWNEGRVVGDYTIPVAERIPEDVLADIRAKGGGLRLKFRLKPDGVLFGWDIERKADLGDVSKFDMPGGVFLETRY